MSILKPKSCSVMKMNSLQIKGASHVKSSSLIARNVTLLKVIAMVPLSTARLFTNRLQVLKSRNTGLVVLATLDTRLISIDSSARKLLLSPRKRKRSQKRCIHALPITD
jgi:hypothetical protein